MSTAGKHNFLKVAGDGHTSPTPKKPKPSYLYRRTLDKIEQGGGRRKIVADLERYANRLEGKARSHIHTLIIDISTLFFTEANIEYRMSDKATRETIRKTLAIINGLIEHQKCPSLLCVKEFIDYNLQYTDNVIRLK